MPVGIAISYTHRPQLICGLAKVKEDKKDKKEATPAKKSKKGGGKIDKTLISGPVSPTLLHNRYEGADRGFLFSGVQSIGTFKHVAHMGYDSEKGFSSTGVDPSWQKLLEQLAAKGVSAKDIRKNEQFIKDYVQQQGGIEQVSLSSFEIWTLADMDTRRPLGNLLHLLLRLLAESLHLPHRVPDQLDRHHWPHLQLRCPHLHHLVVQPRRL